MKKLISHRGNLYGRKIKWENHPRYIEDAVNAGYDVEIDVWFLQSQLWFLGHNRPTYRIDFSFLEFLNNIGVVWCHAKNIRAMYNLQKEGIHCFSHDTDMAVFTSKGYIWTYPGRLITSNSILVNFTDRADSKDLDLCAGVCSDNIGRFRCL